MKLGSMCILKFRTRFDSFTNRYFDFVDDHANRYYGVSLVIIAFDFVELSTIPHLMHAFWSGKILNKILDVSSYLFIL